MTFSFKEAISFAPAIALLVSASALWVSWNAYRVSDANLQLNDPSVGIKVVEAKIVGLSDCCLELSVNFVVSNFRNRIESLNKFSVSDISNRTFASLPGAMAHSNLLSQPLQINSRSQIQIVSYFSMRFGGASTEIYKGELLKRGLFPQKNPNTGIAMASTDEQISLEVFNSVYNAIFLDRNQNAYPSTGVELRPGPCDSLDRLIGNYPKFCPKLEVFTVDGFQFESPDEIAEMSPGPPLGTSGRKGAFDWGWLAPSFEEQMKAIKDTAP